MSGKSQLCTRSAIAATIAAIACWLWLPGSRWEHQAFLAVLSASEGGTPVVTGAGTRDQPWQVRIAAQPRPRASIPTVVTLDDDPQAIFQSYPHAPIDLAVIFSNLQRLGATKAACAPLLAWEKPDAIGLTALEEQMLAFQSLVIAVPLTRGPVMQPLPAAFRRASLPIEAIKGDTSALPVVNRVALPDMIYGPDNTLAGFQVIDSEPADRTLPLLARWDYRVVLAFPLLAAMQQLGVDANQLDVRIGDSIQLGRNGPRIRIDEFGHMAAPAGEAAAGAPPIRAEQLIDADRTAITGRDFKSPLLCDRRGTMDPASLRYHRQLPAVVGSILAPAQDGQAKSYTRPVASRELYAILVTVIIATATSLLAGPPRVVAVTALIAAIAVGHFLAFQHLQLWLPAIPAVAGMLAALVASIGGTPRKGVLVKADEGLNYVRYSGE